MNIVLVFLVVIDLFITVFSVELKQVVVFSRHNVRTPLSHELTSVSPKPWPPWTNKPGELTEKGALLEGYMGKYFSSWFRSLGLQKENCPNETFFFAYANNKQRTIASAEAFVDKAFPYCNIKVHHSSGNQKDNIFNPVIHDASENFKIKAKAAMNERLLQLNVKAPLKKMQQILDYKHSKNCKIYNLCDLSTDITTVEELIVGEEPELKGPLHIGNSVIDTFKMQYYEGMTMQNVGWGEMENSNLWNELMYINAAYHDVRFNTSIVAKDIATPLILFIKNLLITENNTPKITLLMGHDANLYTLINSLDFKPYLLEDQHEKTPVGGKIVFQKWWDKVTSKYLLKIEYVYQTSLQLRSAIELDADNPPRTLLLELKGCAIDKEGFCLWDKFIKILDKF